MSAAARNGPNKTPFLRTSNVLWDDIDLSSVDEMSTPEHELPAKLLRPGDLLVCEGGEIGRAAIWNGETTTMSFQNHVHRLRPIVEEAEPRFYAYFLQCAFTQLGIYEGAGNKTTIPNLSRSRLAALEVPQPKIHEQRAIVTVLARVRNAIDIQYRCAQLARNLKRVALQTVFTSGLRGEPQKETAIGTLPEHWRVTRIGSVRERVQYGTSTKCTYQRSPHPVLRIPNIERGRVIPDDLKYCMLSDAEASRYRLTPGDLIFIRTNGVLDRIGSCAVYSGNLPNALFASYPIRARLRLPPIEPRYVAFFFGSELGHSSVASRAVQASDGKYNLNTAAIDNFQFPLPPTIEEQTQIVEVVPKNWTGS